MDNLKQKLITIIEELKLKHARRLSLACNAVDDDMYNLQINESSFIQGQITMAREILKTIEEGG